ncbi:MAG: anthranilate phosphoribosyltransferase [Succinivibrionaceae bacterium]
MKELIEKLYNHENLSKEETSKIFDEIFSGNVDPILLGSILTALKINGLTASEIAGAATSMLKAAIPLPIANRTFEVGEIVGTGGDGQNTINISTISSIVAATIGLHIAKHGNKSVSSKTGASDLLNALGVNIKMTPEQAANTYEKVGVTFLFAPTYHSAMKYAVPVRQALKTRTIFNVLGPLTNPASADYMVIGVYSKELVPIMVEVLKSNGVKRALVVYGSGLDEICLHGTNNIAELKEDGSIIYYTLEAQDFGLNNYPLEDIRGGDPLENKEITLNILKGHGTKAQNSIVAANTGALLYIGKFTDSIKSGTELALKTLESGKPFDTLQKFISISNQAV